MVQEQSSQGLAIYGAVVGTVAIGINLFNYLHTKQKDIVRLSVECDEDEKSSENIVSLHEESKPDGSSPSLMSVYCVTVRNIGNTEAYIQEVGVIDESGIRHTTLVLANHKFLVPIASANPISIKPKAMQKFTIYLKRGEQIFTAIRCFVIDQQQKQWNRKLKLPKMDRHLRRGKP